MLNNDLFSYGEYVDLMVMFCRHFLLLSLLITIHYRLDLQQLQMMVVVEEHFHQPVEQRKETGVYPEANTFSYLSPFIFVFFFFSLLLQPNS
jgi:hypothetical protein